MDAHAYLRTLLADIATTPGINVGARHDLLSGALAPLGPVVADRQASEIEAHAFWVRHGNHQTDADVGLAACVDVAAYLAGHALVAEDVA
jgi:hypothetical protein